ncbi:hypothetical protein GALL_306860 [mine drainage metagenome]|uniref:Uncharacterized protein n=1 Tax=mine drainage metagenome TaxID=410659 RepID=A0A1J5RCP8_9ZZZZ
MEQLRRLLRRDADAGIADTETQHGCRFERGIYRDIDQNVACMGELDRIAGQVEQHLAQTAGVAAQHVGHGGVDARHQRQVLPPGLGGQKLGHAFDHVGQGEVFFLDAHAPGFDLGKIENVVDDVQQGIGRFHDGMDLRALLSVEGRIEQQLGHAQHAVHRRADFVAHGGDEFRLHARGFQCGIPRLRQFLLVTLALGDVGADRDVLVGFSPAVQERHDGGIDPVVFALFVAVPDLAFPHISLRNGAPHVEKEFRRMVAGFENAVVLPEQLFTAVSADLAEFVVDVGDLAGLVGDGDDGMQIECELLILEQMIRLLQCLQIAPQLLFLLQDMGALIEFFLLPRALYGHRQQPGHAGDEIDFLGGELPPPGAMRPEYAEGIVPVADDDADSASYLVIGQQARAMEAGVQEQVLDHHRFAGPQRERCLRIRFGIQGGDPDQFRLQAGSGAQQEFLAIRQQLEDFRHFRVERLGDFLDRGREQLLQRPVVIQRTPGKFEQCVWKTHAGAAVFCFLRAPGQYVKRADKADHGIAFDQWRVTQLDRNGLAVMGRERELAVTGHAFALGLIAWLAGFGTGGIAIAVPAIHQGAQLPADNFIRLSAQKRFHCRIGQNDHHGGIGEYRRLMQRIDGLCPHGCRPFRNHRPAPPVHES